MYTGDSVLGVSLNVQTPKPLDVRTVVRNTEDLFTISPTNAYQGMTVAVVSTGNLYMLIDKNKINEKAGWKASYESIQIIACTLQEYEEWKDNTKEDYTPIDENKSYIYENTYYYIYEDSMDSE
jgi:nucleoside-diphosphate-sugar epimerase